MVKLKDKITLCISLSILLLIIGLNISPVYCQVNIETVRSKVIEAYLAILDISREGGNVTILVNELNQAIDILEGVKKGSLSDAYNIANDIINNYPQLKEEAIANRNFTYMIWVIEGVVSVIVIYILYRLIPKAIWRAWLKIRGSNVVIVRKERANRKSMYISGEVRAVVLALVVVIGVFAISQAYMAGRVIEPFSELGLLGKKMKIGDYPREVIAGQPIFFYVYVGNHLGYPAYYQVRIMIGDAETNVDPAPLNPILIRSRILLHNETWIFPVNITIMKPGLNQRIIVELWIYNTTTHTFTYHHRWNQLWINVTKI